MAPTVPQVVADAAVKLAGVAGQTQKPPWLINGETQPQVQVGASIKVWLFEQGVQSQSQVGEDLK